MEKKHISLDEKRCCGCGACVSICPVNAIEMRTSSKGFMYPQIKLEKCINCGKCKNICNYGETVKTRENLDSYVAISKSNELLKKSSSGGVFASIARAFIENGGIVYGASMNYEKGKLNIKHIGIENLNQLYKIQGSKYVQSFTIDTYKIIKEQLKQNKLVLFSGTPCQINGLKQFLNKEYKNLYPIDIICHGVPSQKMFNDYISTIEKKKKIKIYNVIFRDKEKGWGLNGYIEYKQKDKKNKRMKLYKNESSYYYLFLKGLIYRESCYNCPYASEKRPGDITIGDYWGIEKEDPEILEKIDKKKGISCLIVNKVSGKMLLEQYGKYLNLYTTTFEKIKRNNGQLIKPVQKNNMCIEVMQQYEEYGYIGVEKIFKKMMGLNIYKNHIINPIKTLLKRIL